MEERRLRLQEAANRCVPRQLGLGQLGALAGPPPHSLRPQPVLPSRRFCSQVTLTPEEREQRALYAAILEYEQDHVSPRARGGGAAEVCRGGAALWRARVSLRGPWA